jgi:hypothetical protein
MLFSEVTAAVFIEDLPLLRGNLDEYRASSDS